MPINRRIGKQWCIQTVDAIQQERTNIHSINEFQKYYASERSWTQNSA